MRVLIQEKAGEFQTTTQFSPPPLLPAAQSSPSKCDARSCPWWPYSSSKDFKGTATLILVLLLCALLAVALALNAAIRYLLRRRRLNPQHAAAVPPPAPPKPPICCAATQVVEAPTVVYSSGLKLAGQEAECTICLSEFFDGDTIRVLGKCNHGFHVHCIEAWLLSSHSNCPTCRASCLSSSAVDHNSTSDAHQNHNQSNPLTTVPEDNRRATE